MSNEDMTTYTTLIHDPILQQPMSDNVQEFVDFLGSSSALVENTTMQDLLAQNLKLFICGRVVFGWRKAAVIEKPSRDNTIITSKDIFKLTRSATREEAMNVIKAKEDASEAATAFATTKKVQAKEKTARATSPLVITGSELLAKIE
jgi:hypothetical protein